MEIQGTHPQCKSPHTGNPRPYEKAYFVIICPLIIVGVGGHWGVVGPLDSQKTLDLALDEFSMATHRNGPQSHMQKLAGLICL